MTKKNCILFLIFLTSSFCFAKGKKGNMFQQSDTLILPAEQMQSIDIKCNQRLNSISERLKPQIINSGAEFNNFFYNSCNSSLKIDFNSNTLLYFPLETSGCKDPEYTRTIKMVEKKIIFNITILHEGNKSDNSCALLIMIYSYILIPKIKKENSVEFNIIESYVGVK